MIINGIEYFVGLYTMGEDGSPNDEMYFKDFYALNDFIRQNADNSKYLRVQMCYSLVEVIDGEPDAFSWLINIQWSVFSDEQIQIEIENFIDDEKEKAEYWEKADEFDRGIHYVTKTTDYRKKQAHFKDLAYVCPTCIRDVEDCRCAVYPYYLVQIDKLMVPIIRELNKKGYRTTGCCAGHPDDAAFTVSGVYIAFAEEYDFDEPFPEGGKYSKSRHTIQYQPTVEGYDNLLAFQQETLDKLADWVEALLEVEFFDDSLEDN